GKGIRTAPRDALLRDSSDPDRAGATFGYHRFMDSAGATVGPLLALALLTAGLSLREVIAVSIVPAVLTMFVLRAVDAEPAVRVLGLRGGVGDLLARQLGRRLPAPALARARPLGHRGGPCLRRLQHALLRPLVAARPPVRPARPPAPPGLRPGRLRPGLRRVRARDEHGRGVAALRPLRMLHGGDRRRGARARGRPLPRAASSNGPGNLP